MFNNKFDKYRIPVQVRPLDGVRVRYYFPNGYGASIVRSDFSYGGDRGLFELAVLKNDELCYTTEITDDVIGYLKEEEVNELLERIFNLEVYNEIHQ